MKLIIELDPAQFEEADAIQFFAKVLADQSARVNIDGYALDGTVVEVSA